MAPTLTLTEDSGRSSVTIRYGCGLAASVPVAPPAQDLIAATEIDYSVYRREVQRLWDEHWLFEERPIVRVDEPRSMRGVSRADFDDFKAQASALPALLKGIDPIGSVWVREQLGQIFQSEDDGTARCLLDMGGQALQALWEPVRAQVRLRNIFEMTFDGTERISQRERLEKLRGVYPDIARQCDPSRVQEGHSFPAYNLFDLCLLELALYFRQDRQRIARCEYCWGYFTPKTKKATRYCDRVTDGFRCKDRGARFQRNESLERDEALKIYKLLWDRMYARNQRYMGAAPWDRNGLIPMDNSQFEAWSRNASAVRVEYLNGVLTAEAFLRRVDTTHELTCYETSKAELVEETPWQHRVARDVGFDPEQHYPEAMMCLDLTPGTPQEWQVIKRDELRRRDQKGHQSLREKYRKG